MKLYRIFLPKIDNNGQPIATKKMRKVTDAIVAKFGAYSANPFAVLPLIQGVWTSDRTKRVYREQVWLIELFVEDTFNNQKWLKSFKEIVRQELDQEELFVIVQNAEILT